MDPIKYNILICLMAIMNQICEIYFICPSEKEPIENI